MVRKASRRIVAGTSSFRDETAQAARRRVTSRAAALAACGDSAEDTDAAAPPIAEARRKPRLFISHLFIPQLWLNHRFEFRNQGSLQALSSTIKRGNRSARFAINRA
jgi:hypothetical protein